MSKLLDALRASVGMFPSAIDLGGVTKAGNVLFDNASGIGATGINKDIDYFGLGVLMKPRDFLALNPPRLHRPTDWLRQAIVEGKGIGSPYLKTAFDPSDMTINVRGHEGRGRSIVMDELQPEMAVPVHVEMRKQMSPEDLDGKFLSLGNDTMEMRARSIDPEQVLRSWIHPDMFHGAPNPYAKPFKPRMIIHQGRSYFMPPSGKMMDITDDLPDVSLVRALRGGV